MYLLAGYVFADLQCTRCICLIPVDLGVPGFCDCAFSTSSYTRIECRTPKFQIRAARRASSSTSSVELSSVEIEHVERRIERRIERRVEHHSVERLRASESV